MSVIELVGNSAILVWIDTRPRPSYEEHIMPFTSQKMSRVIWNLATGYRLKKLRKGNYRGMRKAK